MARSLALSPPTVRSSGDRSSGALAAETLSGLQTPSAALSLLCAAALGCDRSACFNSALLRRGVRRLAARNRVLESVAEPCILRVQPERFEERLRDSNRRREGNKRHAQRCAHGSSPLVGADGGTV